MYATVHHKLSNAISQCDVDAVSTICSESNVADVALALALFRDNPPFDIVKVVIDKFNGNPGAALPFRTNLKYSTPVCFSPLL